MLWLSCFTGAAEEFLSQPKLLYTRWHLSLQHMLILQVATLAWTQGSNSSNWPDVRLHQDATSYHSIPDNAHASRS